MQSPSSITFRNLEPSDAVRDHINQRIEELEKYHSRIISCDVVVKAASRSRHATGREFEVQLTVHVPGPDIHVSRSIGRSQAQEDVNLAIHKVFDAARRELKEQSRQAGNVDVKHHPPISHGIVDRLFEKEGYGFIVADDGREFFFERDNLTTGEWDDLRVDMKVRFREERGEKGDHAASVGIIS